ncbi:MAG: SDR family NAD(P)-dependent oxidoreductase [Clostridiales Family XIII bacterium]|jgi:NADP-dependent 3-hydroxy acid dehydrogenase YdfG|nr:SDR family NAD(P)-dependent oxidoreductase [Clostridiales Family XIII bacterium]
MTEFENKTALITGAASGFGYEFAKECTKRGMNTVLVDIDKKRLSEADKAISAHNPNTLTVCADVSIYEEVQRAIKMTLDRYKTLDLLINNAGVYFVGNIWDMPLRDYRWMLDVNVLSIVYGMKEAIPVMMRQGTPCHILNTASIAGCIAAKGMSAYHMTKHAVVALSESVLLDLQKAKAHIGISVFCPGFVKTDLHNCERHRPERYKAEDPYYDSAIYQKNVALVDQFITTGEPVDPIAQIVFQAIEEKRFYIKTEATDKMYGPWLKKRFDNIVNNDNPDVSHLY